MISKKGAAKSSEQLSEPNQYEPKPEPKRPAAKPKKAPAVPTVSVGDLAKQTGHTLELAGHVAKKEKTMTITRPLRRVVGLRHRHGYGPRKPGGPATRRSLERRRTVSEEVGCPSCPRSSLPRLCPIGRKVRGPTLAQEHAFRFWIFDPEARDPARSREAATAHDHPIPTSSSRSAVANRSSQPSSRV